MGNDRFVVLGLARARTPWYSEMAQWSTSGLAPIEFIKCLSAQEVRARIAAGRAISAFIADATTTGLDRDLIDDVRAAGCAVLIVDDPRVRRDWIKLGASAVLPSPFDLPAVVDALHAHASTIRPTDRLLDLSSSSVDDTDIGWRGDLVAVIGPGGVGTSTVAMGVAQYLASRPGHAGAIALVDAALAGDLAMFHDVGDVIPGLLEMVEAHRQGHPDRAAVRSMFFDIEERGYHLLLGLRRRRDWTALRSRAFDAAIESIRSTYATTVADCHDDLDGSEDTGSIDLDDRNHTSRHLVRTAKAVLVVGRPGTKGAHAIVRGVNDLVSHGVESERIAVVINRAPKSRRIRNEMSKAALALLEPMLDGHSLAAAPVFVPEVGRIEAAHRQALRLPDRLCGPVGALTLGLLQSLEGTTAHSEAPERIAVGSLGHLAG